MGKCAETSRIEMMNWILAERKYYKPKSLTWWVGCVLVLSGVLQSNAWEIPVISDTLRPIMEAMTGAADPKSKIMAGLGFIGLRGAL